MRRRAIAGYVGIAIALGAAALALVEVPRRQQLAAGAALYGEHCATCHGANLEGQANWNRPGEDGRLPAPPHDATGHTWHHSDADLFLITKKGLAAIVPDYQSNMPAFEGVLSDAEISDVLEFIKSKWPERERAYQRNRTLVARSGS